MKRFRVVVGYDGSPDARAMVSSLNSAGLPIHTHVTVISIADVYLPGERRTADPADPLESMANSIEQLQKRGRAHVQRAKRMSEIAARQIQSKFPTWAVRARAFADSPAWGLLGEASRQKADLIILGAQGHTLLGRLILGSVSHKVVTHAPCSVRIVRHAPGHSDKGHRILIGYDGFRNSAKAVEAVAARHWQPGTRVRILGAVYSANDQKWMEKRIQPMREKLAHRGLIVDRTVYQGDPRRALLHEARRWKADSIVVGARGQSAIQRILLGSVSTTLVSHASCTVEVVR